MFICTSHKPKNHFFFKRSKSNVHNKVAIPHRLDNDN